jgi:hypothetical protein
VTAAKVAMALYKNPSDTFRSFEDLFKQLAPHLPSADNNGDLASAVQGGARLVRNAIRGFEGANVTFVRAEIGAELVPVDIIRVFNVMAYFDGDFRNRAEQWALQTLVPGGLFICGCDGSREYGSALLRLSAM